MNFCLSDLVPPLRWSDASTITLLRGQPELPDAWWRSLPMPRVLAAIGPESLGELITEIALEHWPAAAIGDVLPALHVLDPDEADEPQVAIALDRAGSWAGLLALTSRELVDQPFIQARPVLNTLFSAVLVRLAPQLHAARPATQEPAATAEAPAAQAEAPAAEAEAPAAEAVHEAVAVDEIAVDEDVALAAEGAAIEAEGVALAAEAQPEVVEDAEAAQPQAEDAEPESAVLEAAAEEPAPEPAQEPAATSEPEAVPESAAVLEAEAAQESEPAPEPEAAAEPADEPEAAAEFAHEPERAEEPADEPEAAAEPADEPEPAEEPAHEPEAAAEPVQAPASMFEPAHEPEPTPAPEPAPAPQAAAAKEQPLSALIEGAFADLDDKSWAVAQNRIFTDQPSAVEQLAKLFAVSPTEIDATETELRARLRRWLASDEAAPYRAHLDTLRETIGPAAPRDKLIAAAAWHAKEIRALEVPAWQFVKTTLAPEPPPAQEEEPFQGPPPAIHEPFQAPPPPQEQPARFGAFTPANPSVSVPAEQNGEQEAKPYQPLKDVSQTRRCFRQPDGRWYLRVDVTADQLAGGECALPTGFASYLGLSPGESRTVRSAAGELTMSWHGRPVLESVERLLADVGAKEGGHVFLTLSDEGVLRARHLPVAAPSADKITKALRLVCYTAPDAGLEVAARVIATRIGMTGPVALQDVLARLRERGDRDLLALLD